VLAVLGHQIKTNQSAISARPDSVSTSILRNASKRDSLASQIAGSNLLLSQSKNSKSALNVNQVSAMVVTEIPLPAKNVKTDSN
jgi:hypothetical protein